MRRSGNVSIPKATNGSQGTHDIDPMSRLPNNSAKGQGRRENYKWHPSIGLSTCHEKGLCTKQHIDAAFHMALVCMRVRNRNERHRPQHIIK